MIYRRLIQESPDLVLLIRSGETQARVLSGFEILTGFTGEEAAGLSLRDLIHGEDLCAIKMLPSTLSAVRPRAATRLRLKHRDGRFVPVQASFHRLPRDGGLFDLAIVIRDVAAGHGAGAVELASLAETDANEANQAKTEFLARMSHEIRTPLNAVIGFCSLMLEVPGLPQQARRYSERIKGAGHALLTIVDDILDFSKVEAGAIELKPSPFALPLLIDECFSIVQQAALDKHISLDVDLAGRMPAGVLGDEARLRQILLNLLNNAIKFTHEGSVRLDVRHEPSAAARYRIKFSVTDTGIGIAPEHQKLLFQRFKQVDGTIRRTYGGTGLGLAITKQLVELMGGELGVTSEKGQGSTFWFAIDLPPAPLLLTAGLPVPPRPGGRLKFLLAEDVPLNQELVRALLQSDGHEVDVVGDGAEAIMAVQHTAYDAVLMDIQMPHIDGFTATRIIRDLPEPARDVLIVAITANVLARHGELARHAGMDAVVHKPFTAADIYAALNGRQAARLGPGTAVDAPLLDENVAAKLSGLLGEPVVARLLETLVHSLDHRFTSSAATEEGRAALRRDAHASVAGAAMLGFKRFAERCRALETSADGLAFEAALASVREDAVTVTVLARSLAANGFSIPVPFKVSGTV